MTIELLYNADEEWVILSGFYEELNYCAHCKQEIKVGGEPFYFCQSFKKAFCYKCQHLQKEIYICSGEKYSKVDKPHIHLKILGVAEEPPKEEIKSEVEEPEQI